MTKNRNLKILKQKLENVCRLNQNIVNTQAYLDKQTYSFKFMGMPLSGWNNLSLQMTILGLFVGGFFSFMSYWYRLDSYYIILYASVGALGSLFLTFLDSSFNISQKQQRLSNSLLEYADNSVLVRVARSSSSEGAEEEREMVVRKNEMKDGLVRTDEPHRSSRSMRNRNVKAEELLRTVRNMKKESGDSRQEDAAMASERFADKDGKNSGADGEIRRDIDYLKNSLDQIAASKEKPRQNDDWAKNLAPEELKVISEIMRQYFAGN